MEELEKAHEDYELRKFEIIRKLEILHDNTLNMVTRQILEQAIEFIKEREV